MIDGEPLYLTQNETRTLEFEWDDPFTGITGVLRVGGFDDNSFVKDSTDWTVTATPTVATCKITVDFASGRYQSQLRLTTGADTAIIDGPPIIVEPEIPAA